MLQEKVAVVYGTGGPIGGAIAAAFVASDLARTLTATDVNISCGAIVD